MENLNDDSEKVLLSNISFYLMNMKALIRLRPNVELDFGEIIEGQPIRYNFVGDLTKYQGEELFNLPDDLKAINTAIITNCFGLFEACYEQLLLSYISMVNLSGIQEKVMTKYLENVVYLSSEQRYAEEFHFLSGTKIKEFLSEDEYAAYTIIKKFYVIRNLLVHGSVTKHEFLPGKRGGKLNLDLEDSKYQELIDMLKKELSIPVPSDSLNLHLLMEINSVASFLAIAVYKVMKKMLQGNNSVLKFIKEKELDSTENL